MLVRVQATSALNLPMTVIAGIRTLRSAESEVQLTLSCSFPSPHLGITTPTTTRVRRPSIINVKLFTLSLPQLQLTRNSLLHRVFLLNPLPRISLRLSP